MTQSQVMKFHNKAFSLEYVMINGDPWFKGREAAGMIQYQNTQKAIRDHVDDDDKMKFEDLLEMRCIPVGLNETNALDWNARNTIYINESGLYSLILRSSKPKAKQFKRWITFTVLPCIRKQGNIV